MSICHEKRATEIFNGQTWMHKFTTVTQTAAEFCNRHFSSYHIVLLQGSRVTFSWPQA